MVFLTAASLPHACGTLPSGCAAISLVIWINRFVSRLSPKSALPNSSCAQLSALVISSCFEASIPAPPLFFSYPPIFHFPSFIVNEHSTFDHLPQYLRACG